MSSPNGSGCLDTLSGGPPIGLTLDASQAALQWTTSSAQEVKPQSSIVHMRLRMIVMVMKEQASFAQTLLVGLTQAQDVITEAIFPIFLSGSGPVVVLLRRKQVGNPLDYFDKDFADYKSGFQSRGEPYND